MVPLVTLSDVTDIMARVNENAAQHHLTVPQMARVNENAAQHHLTVPHPFLSLFKHSFIYAGPTFRNSLPFHITHTDNLFSLKQKLKLYLKT